MSCALFLCCCRFLLARDIPRAGVRQGDDARAGAGLVAGGGSIGAAAHASVALAGEGVRRREPVPRPLSVLRTERRDL